MLEKRPAALFIPSRAVGAVPCDLPCGVLRIVPKRSSVDGVEHRPRLVFRTPSLTTLFRRTASGDLSSMAHLRTVPVSPRLELLSSRPHNLRQGAVLDADLADLAELPGGAQSQAELIVVDDAVELGPAQKPTRRRVDKWRTPAARASRENFRSYISQLAQELYACVFSKAWVLDSGPPQKSKSRQACGGRCGVQARVPHNMVILTARSSSPLCHHCKRCEYYITLSVALKRPYTSRKSSGPLAE